MSNMIQVQRKMNYVLIAVNAVSMEQFVLLVQSLMYKYFFSLSLSAQLKPSGELDFRPSAEFPALQYLDSVDPGSVSDRAGLRAGDFILEVFYIVD